MELLSLDAHIADFKASIDGNLCIPQQTSKNEYLVCKRFWRGLMFGKAV